MEKIAKWRDPSIDILKFLAVILVLNSHSDVLYGQYSQLGTGGAIADSIFLFCSGYTLQKVAEQKDNFLNWYKRRINRIFPSMFAWALISTFLLGFGAYKVGNIYLWGGPFVMWVFILYVFYYICIRVLKEKYTLIALGIIGAIVIYFFHFLDYPTDNMYAVVPFVWFIYFGAMILGAYVKKNRDLLKFNIKVDAILFVVSVASFYILKMLSVKYSGMSWMGLLTIIPLLTTVFFLYKVATNTSVQKLTSNKYLSPIVLTIAGLCLDSYIVQGIIIRNTSLNHLFPLNIVLIWLAVLFIAYANRCLARFISQTFKDTNYDWRSIIKLY